MDKNVQASNPNGLNREDITPGKHLLWVWMDTDSGSSLSKSTNICPYWVSNPIIRLCCLYLCDCS